MANFFSNTAEFTLLDALPTLNELSVPLAELSHRQISFWCHWQSFITIRWLSTVFAHQVRRFAHQVRRFAHQVRRFAHQVRRFCPPSEALLPTKLRALPIKRGVLHQKLQLHISTRDQQPLHYWVNQQFCMILHLCWPIMEPCHFCGLGGDSRPVFQKPIK